MNLVVYASTSHFLSNSIRRSRGDDDLLQRSGRSPETGLEGRVNVLAVLRWCFIEGLIAEKSKEECAGGAASGAAVVFHQKRKSKEEGGGIH